MGGRGLHSHMNPWREIFSVSETAIGDWFAFAVQNSDETVGNFCHSISDTIKER
jgi:hypothetical protein